MYPTERRVRLSDVLFLRVLVDYVTVPAIGGLPAKVIPLRHRVPQPSAEAKRWHPWLADVAIHQFPVTYDYCRTIHKTQGLTLDQHRRAAP